MDDVRQVPQRGAELDGHDKLAQDLAGAGRDQGRPHQGASGPVRDQLQRPAMKVVDVAARRLGRVDGGHHDVEAALARRLLRPADRSHLGVGERDPRHRGVVGAGVLAAQPASHDLAVVVSQVGEAADPGDVAGAEDAGARLERLGIDLEPSALGLGQAGRAPGLEVGPPACGDQEAVA